MFALSLEYPSSLQEDGLSTYRRIRVDSLTQAAYKAHKLVSHFERSTGKKATDETVYIIARRHEDTWRLFLSHMHWAKVHFARGSFLGAWVPDTQSTRIDSRT
jgi:hypothetical protein